MPLWAWLVPALSFAVLLLASALGIGLVLALLCGASLLGTVIAAVHHAEVIAHRVGEPFGKHGIERPGCYGANHTQRAEHRVWCARVCRRGEDNQDDSYQRDANANVFGSFDAAGNVLHNALRDARKPNKIPQALERFEVDQKAQIGLIILSHLGRQRTFVGSRGINALQVLG